MEFERREAPYLAPDTSVQAVMLQVLLALIPAALAHVWFFGPGLIFNFVIAALFCIGGEAAVMRARGRDPFGAGRAEPAHDASPRLGPVRARVVDRDLGDR